MNEFNTCKKEKEIYYRIGMFAQMNHVSIKTLRYYDDIGLLHPSYVDESNGYRYYRSSQMPQLYRIIALREIGFTILEIKQILNGESQTKLLQKKKHALMMEQINTSKRIALIDWYLDGNIPTSDYSIVIKSLPKVDVACMLVTLETYAELCTKMPEMGAKMEKLGCECMEPDYCFTIYQEPHFKETNISAIICESVTEKKEDCDGLVFKTFEQVPLATCVLHKGPYNGLFNAYSSLVKFIEESDYEIVDLPREVYIDGVWNKDDPADWLTEIQIPVKKRQ